MGRYRAVVIGCGRIGSSFSAEARAPGIYSHAQAYREHSRTELVGLCDTDPNRLADAGQLWEVEASLDAVELCRHLQPEIVSICTPDATHFSIAHSLLLEIPPRLLFIEKPLALRAAQAEEILRLAKRKGSAIAINYSRRFSPAFRVLSDELKAGQHGQPLLAWILYGKGLLHNGGHAIDLMRFWLGEPVKCNGYPAAWGPEDDDTYTVDLWFKGGCRVRLEAFDERVATVFDLDFMTERSRWRFRLGGDCWEFSKVVENRLYPGYKNYAPTARERTDARFAQPLAGCLWHAVDNLVEFIDGTAPLLCSGKDGLAVLNWVERIRGGLTVPDEDFIYRR